MIDDNRQSGLPHHGGNGFQELDELIATYLDRLNSGESLDPMDILAE